jgi:hypothetical protein
MLLLRTLVTIKQASTTDKEVTSNSRLELIWKNDSELDSAQLPMVKRPKIILWKINTLALFQNVNTRIDVQKVDAIESKALVLVGIIGEVNTATKETTANTATLIAPTSIPATMNSSSIITALSAITIPDWLVCHSF